MQEEEAGLGDARRGVQLCPHLAVQPPRAGATGSLLAGGSRQQSPTSSLEFFDTVVPAKIEKHTWYDPAPPWANHEDQGRSTPGSQHRGHQVGSRLMIFPRARVMMEH